MDRIGVRVSVGTLGLMHFTFVTLAACILPITELD